MVVREWLQLVEMLKRQVIIDFVPEDLEGGRGVKFQLAGVVQGSEVSTVHDRFTKLPDRPFAWMAIVIWLGWILGIALLGFLLFKGFQMWSQNRGESGGYVGEMNPLVPSVESWCDRWALCRGDLLSCGRCDHLWLHGR